ncbi:hypothetical protein PCANC_20528 [Puccinia coronata f. sp. avenae]|uniref:Uncharacterized protein n=1 Tax=Puccinia coronata f. sp. avenae TaxID=200324 RepID=A0A2N5SA54_9BASI|nr:hypothetical protein PCANC_20528 [Puccinia coronata f. sp. avenae]
MSQSQSQPQDMHEDWILQTPVFCPIDAATSPISPSNASPPRASHWSLLQRVSLNRSPILPTPSYTRPKSLVPPLPIRRAPTLKRPPSLKRQMSEFLNAQSGQTPDPPSSAPGSTDEKVAKLSRDMLNFDARLSTLIDLLNSSPIFNPPP